MACLSCSCDGIAGHSRHHRHRRPHRSRQDRADQGADREGHRPAQGGEGARHLDRPRLRIFDLSRRRAPAWSTCPGTSASSATCWPAPTASIWCCFGRGRRRRDAADRGASRHPAPARRARADGRDHQDRSGGAARLAAVARGDRAARQAPGSKARRSLRCRRLTGAGWTSCAPRSRAKLDGLQRAAPPGSFACRSIAPSSSRATAWW